MKSKILSLLTIAVFGLGMTACHDEAKTTPSDQKGQVSMRSMGVDIDNAEKVINTSARATVDLSDFIIKIYDSKNALVNAWKYAEMPELFSLPVGSYRVDIYSHEVQKAEWEHPYFTGSKDFTITDGNITEIGIVTCKLSNIKVTIKFDSSLLKYLTDDAKVTVIANDEGSLVFTPKETRSGYFEALKGSSTLVAEFAGTVNGKYKTMRHVITDVEAGQHRIITFIVKTGKPDKPDEDGQIVIGSGIYLDVEVVDENLTGNITIGEDNIPDDDRPGGEDGGEDPNPPTPPTPGEDTDAIKVSSETLSFDKVNDVATTTTGIVLIEAKNGIQHFIVKIASDNENFVNSVKDLMPIEFDLAYPGDNAEAFESLGFPTGDKVINATNLTFDISQFIPLLSAFPGNHTFTLNLTDNKSVNKIVSLKFIAK